jgi:hypothetical protein
MTKTNNDDSSKDCQEEEQPNSSWVKRNGMVALDQVEGNCHPLLTQSSTERCNLNGESWSHRNSYFRNRSGAAFENRFN